MAIPAGDTSYLRTSVCAQDAFVVTPSDSVNFTNPARALYVGVAGNITLLTVDGSTVLFSNVQLGILPVACVRVNATGTTATNIVGLT